MGHKMRIAANILILFSLLLTPCSYALADISNNTQTNLTSYNQLIRNADIIHFSESSHFIERTTGYESKWNGAIFTPVKGKKNIYSIKFILGGINKSNSKKQVIALISLNELEDLKNPLANIGLVKVNGKPAKYNLFLPGSSLNNLIGVTSKSIGEQEISLAKIKPKSPLLFIDAGVIQPGAPARIEYEYTSPKETLVN
jgi:hypothetical protein